MKTITLDDVNDDVLQAIRDGCIVTYPTDTVYGFGCNALDKEAVQKIREMKERPKKPFSIIIPNKEWALHNLDCERSELDNLPGPYTLIFEKKNDCVAPNVSNHKIGIRIPDHPINEVVNTLNIPFITTSANKSGELTIQEKADLSKDLKRDIDYFIDEGRIEGSASTVIDMVEDEILR